MNTEQAHATLEKLKIAWREMNPGSCKIPSMGDACPCVLCQADKIHEFIDGGKPKPYKISYYREQKETGGCITDFMRIDAWSAADAITTAELIGKQHYWNDPYFRVVKIEPWTAESAAATHAT